jgi:adenylosuccinate synthase
VSEARSGEVTLRAGDFSLPETTLTEKIDLIRLRKLQQVIDLIHALGLEDLSEDEMAEVKLLYDTELVAATAQACRYVSDLVTITDEDFFTQLLDEPGNLVTESSHGALLHPYAFVPHTTQIDPTSHELVNELRESNKKVIKIGVARCYMTRHGAGPLVSYNEQLSNTFHETHNAANETANSWLGEFRVGHFDSIMMRYALELSGGAESFSGLMISYMDVLNANTEWGVVDAYEYIGNATDIESYFDLTEGKIVGIKVHPDTQDLDHYHYQTRLTQLLKDCVPIVTTLTPGLEHSLAQVFFKYVENAVGISVIAISQGPRVEDRRKLPAWNHVFGVEQRSVGNHIETKRPLGMDLFWAGENPEWANEKLVSEAIRRRKLFDLLESIYTHVLDGEMPLSQACAEGSITSEEIEELYHELTLFFGDDVNHSRLLLYLPEQLLPNMAKDLISDTEQQWARACREAWFRLMFEREPRANFTDGDILEPVLGEPEYIRKAGHLIPWMIGKNLVNIEDILDLMECSGDDELVRSTVEGLVAARKSNLLDDVNWVRIKEVVAQYPNVNTLDLANDSELVSAEQTFNLHEALQKIDTYLEPESEYVHLVSAGRVAWERQMLTDHAYEKAAKLEVARCLQSDDFQSIVNLIETQPRLGIRVLFLFVEGLFKNKVERAIQFTQDFQDQLRELWSGDKIEIKKLISQGLHHWLRNGIVAEGYLQKVGVEKRSLYRPLDEHFLQDNELVTTGKKIVEQISNHPLLSTYLYPVFVILGSEAKGQALVDADVDGGFVFRPETGLDQREEILFLLKNIDGMQRIDRPVEFWLNKDSAGYGLKHVSSEIPTAVRPRQIHFLMNGVWIFSGDEVEQIRNDLLNRSIDLCRFGKDQEEVRRIMLRQLEYDTILFRMLHKVFGQLYPPRNSSVTIDTVNLDGGSDYWNPEYRRIASLWFLSRVFLPLSAQFLG